VVALALALASELVKAWVPESVRVKVRVVA
jgi:hypothetical protein